MGKNSILAVLLSLLSWVAGPGLAQQAEPASDPCAVTGIRTDVRPDHKGPATQVSLSALLADLREINDVDQTITVDLVFRMKWKDARLIPYAGCQLPKSSVWFPELVLRNSGRLFERWPKQVTVDEGGQVTYSQRISGTFASYHNLKSFPFDKQSIGLWVFPLDWTNAKVQLKLNENLNGMMPVLNISDWQINDVSFSVADALVTPKGMPRSVFEITIDAQRYVSFYIWKVIIPIALIVVMSWSVFWVDSRQFGTQLGLSATSVLTMVAFIFATTALLPRLGYFTMLDKFIAGATVMVFLALLQSLATGYLSDRGFHPVARRIDRSSRLLFPLAFAGFSFMLYGDFLF